MPHHHFPKIHCSNDDVILSNYHHHSFRSLPTYVGTTSHLLLLGLGTLPLEQINVNIRAMEDGLKTNHFGHFCQGFPLVIAKIYKLIDYSRVLNNSCG